MGAKLKMTQIITAKANLYDRDLNLWLETAIAQLENNDFYNLDTKNLIEELQGLAGRDRRELESRLETLLAHILKRCYVVMPECSRGWEVTIMHQRNELRKILRQSPSLKRHFHEVFDECYENARELLRTEYPDTGFAIAWQFKQDIDMVLSAKFWSK